LPLDRIIWEMLISLELERTHFTCALARSLSAFLSSHVSVSIVEQSIVACDTMPASELKIADKWDYAIETGIKRTVYGTVAAGVVAVLLFRKFN
jgi:ABC-type phosphate transport system permease subunit